MKKIYLVGGKWSTVGDKLIYDVQEQELCRQGWLLTSNMKDANVVLIGGGGTLYSRTERNDENYQGRLLDYPLKDLLEARDRKIPIVVAGAGYQRFDGIQNEAAWKEVLSVAKSISVRDRASAEAVRNLIGKTPIDVWPDMAFRTKIMPTPVVSKTTLAVAIGQEGLTEERKLAFEKLLVALKPYYTFLWVPFDVSEYHLYKDYWMPKFGGELVIDELFCGNFIPDVFTTIGAFQHCAGIISTRLHALLLAIMVNRPILHAGKINPKVAAQAQDLFPIVVYPGLVSLEETTGTLVEVTHKIFHKHEYEDLFQKIAFNNYPTSLNHFKFLEEMR